MLPDRLRRTVLLAVMAAAVAMFALPASSAFAGRFLATGHDADLHCHFGQQCHYFRVAVDFVRGGAPDPSKKILVLDRGDQDVAAAFAQDASYGGTPPPFEVVDPRSAAFATLPITTANYSAIVVASDTTCGGCDLNEGSDPDGAGPLTETPDSDAINARKADIEAFFNAGGGIFALAGSDHGDGDPSTGPDTYYDFLPLPVGGAAVSPPFTLTPEGIALGFHNPGQGVGTEDDINCCPTHNAFQEPAAGSSIKVAERDNAGKVETLFVSSGTIGGGKVYTLTLTPGSGSNPVGSPHTVTASLASNTGDEPNETILFTVTGTNPTTGTGTTNSSGDAQFTYTGAAAGNDTITACHDRNKDGDCDGDEATATATKTWTGGGGEPIGGFMTGRSVTYDGLNLFNDNRGLRTTLSGAGDKAKKGQRKKFVLPCDTADADEATFEVKWGFLANPTGNRFTMTSLDSAVCTDNPNYANGAGADFDTLLGSATGTLNGVPGAKATFLIADKADPGVDRDRMHVVITDPSDVVVYEGSRTTTAGSRFIEVGNHDAVGGSPAP